jgi:hypothetical protein
VVRACNFWPEPSLAPAHVPTSYTMAFTKQAGQDMLGGRAVLGFVSRAGEVLTVTWAPVETKAGERAEQIVQAETSVHSALVSTVFSNSHMTCEARISITYIATSSRPSDVGSAPFRNQKMKFQLGILTLPTQRRLFARRRERGPLCQAPSALCGQTHAPCSEPRSLSCLNDSQHGIFTGSQLMSTESLQRIGRRKKVTNVTTTRKRANAHQTASRCCATCSSSHSCHWTGNQTKSATASQTKQPWPP